MTDNKRLNYQHLYYFWSVARAGSITQACAKLGLSQPTISSQLSIFEENIGEKLFLREGRKLKLTDKGRLIYNHADEIFTIGNALIDRLNNVIIERKNKISIGAELSLSNQLLFNILESAMPLLRNSWINLHRGSQSSLLIELYNNSIEYIIAERVISANSKFRTHINFSKSMRVAAYGNSELLGTSKQNYIETIKHSPLILPSKDTGLRISLDKWFVEQNIAPQIVAEIGDETIMFKLAQNGLGLVFAPELLASQICKEFNLKSLDILDSILYELFIISSSKRINNNIMKEIVASIK